jgi:integrase
LLRQQRRTGLIFGRSETRPFDPRKLSLRADKAWAAAVAGAFFRSDSLGFERITLHELRHTCASIFIAAGVNAKALSTYLGHASIQITLDRYGHLCRATKERRSPS